MEDVPAQDEPTVAAVYSEIADTYADHFPSTEPEQASDLAMIDRFLALLPRPRPRVLDAGCGTGRMLPLLAAGGCEASGIDLSPGMIERARRDHPTFDVRVGSLAALPYPDAAFDGLFYWYSTIHTPDADLPAVLSEARRVLKPGGLALFAFQAGRGSRDVAGGLRQLGHDVVLVRHHRTPDEFARLLLAAGFVEVDRSVRGPMGTESDDQAMIIARSVPTSPAPVELTPAKNPGGSRLSERPDRMSYEEVEARLRER